MKARLIWLGCAALLSSACGDSDSGDSPTPASETATFAEQVTVGQGLYGKYCATCHGSEGEGAEGPPLVGLDEGALPLEPPPGAQVRTARFVTVGDVAKFAVENMPPNAPGSLATGDYFAILAFALDANGIELEAKLDADLAESLTIPR